MAHLNRRGLLAALLGTAAAPAAALAKPPAPIDHLTVNGGFFGEHTTRWQVTYGEPVSWDGLHAGGRVGYMNGIAIRKVAKLPPETAVMTFADSMANGDGHFTRSGVLRADGSTTTTRWRKRR